MLHRHAHPHSQEKIEDEEDSKKQKAGLASGLRGEKDYTPSPRRSEGRRDQLGALSEPRREQIPYANPKRTAKFSIIKPMDSNSDATRNQKVQKK